MSTQLKLRRGTTTQHSTFTGAEGEITVDTTKDTVVVHDGATAGGFPLAKESGSALSPTSVTLSSGTANGVAYLNGSKVLTTGSALTFDGANLRLNGGTLAPSGYTVQTITAGANGSILQLGDGTVDLRAQINAGGGAGYFGTYTNSSPLSFQIGGSEQMRLTSTGLGIGTSSPQAKLAIGQYSTSGSNPTIGASILIGESNTGIEFRTTNYLAGYGYRIQGTAFSGLYFQRRSNSATWTDSMVIDDSGNLGLGVPPSAWGSSVYKAIQIGKSGAAYANTNVNTVGLTSNYYNSGSGDVYIFSDYATRYYQYQGQHIWNTAPSGTAGNAITFTQAMTLNASGKLLVGTTTGSSGASVQASFVNSSGGGIQFGYPTTGGGALVGNASGGMQFYGYAGAQGSEGFAERMRIDSSGNVGIGSTSVTGIGANVTTLKIAGRNTTNGGGIQLYSSDDSTVKARTWSETGGWYFDLQTAHPMIFNTSGTERMRIDSSGRVLIGTASAVGTSLLQVNGAGSLLGGNGLYFWDSSNTTAPGIKNTGNALAFVKNNGTETMRIDDSGNVGIGTSSPDRKLTISGTGSTAASSINIKNTTQAQEIQIGCSNASSDSFVNVGTNTGLYFGTNNTERMRIDSSGNVLVGTTSTTKNGKLTNAGEMAALASTGNFRSWTQIYTAAASNNATVDIWLGRDTAGSVIGANILVGHFYVNIIGASGANSASAIYAVTTNGNGNTAGEYSFTVVSNSSRGTSPVSNISIANDAAAGAIKLQATYINNSGVVTGGTSRVVFVGLIG